MVRTSACHADAGSSLQSHGVILTKLDYDLHEFMDFLTVDKQLAEGTVRNHVFEISRFLKWMGSKGLREVSRADVRAHLKEIKESQPGKYKNRLSALKVFLRDYLERGDLVKGFKFPYSPGKVVKAAPTGDLRAFYDELDDPRKRCMFLVYASSGLRRDELLRLKRENIDPEMRMIIPERNGSRTKRTYITFYNEEAATLLEQILPEDPEATVFPVSENYFRKAAKKIQVKTGIHLTPQMLREWFCSEMGRLNVPDRYVDAFCGRVPASVLAKHYTDYSPEKLQEIYDKASLKVLS